MTGKNLIFKKDVESVHGNFRPGDAGYNLDPVWAADMVAAGHAVEGTSNDKDTVDQVKYEAGKITSKDTGRPSTTEHSFTASNVGQQQAAGIVGEPHAAPAGAGSVGRGFVGTQQTHSAAPAGHTAAQGSDAAAGTAPAPGTRP